jgi:hypothetical protein
MQVFKELLSSDVGLMSLAVIVITLGMGGFFIRYFLRHMREDEAREKQRLGPR